MAGTKTLAGIAAILAACSACGCSTAGRSLPIRVGSKNFTEQVVLGEIIAQHLEHRLHRSVERSLNLGGTLLAHQALLKPSRSICIPNTRGRPWPRFSRIPSTTIPPAFWRGSGRNTLQKFHVEWLDPLGIDDSFAMVVNGPQARAQHLETLTDASQAPEAWTLGVGYEFEQRADGLAALEKTYHLRWSGAPKTMDLGLLYKAMEQGQVTMIAANATDGMLSKMDLKVLRDDRHAFPPYQVCIVSQARQPARDAGIAGGLARIVGEVHQPGDAELNFQVDGQHRPVAQVAAEFLKQAHLD